MSLVACPHCATHISNDGTHAGQIVFCPKCRGRFQMPPVQADSLALNHDLRELRKRRVRVTFQEWSEGRFSWSKEFTAEPFLFRLLTLAGVFLTLGGGLAVIRLFGWSAATGVRPVTILFGSLLALLPVAIYAWYKREAFQKEAAINANLDNHIGRLKLMLAERAREAAEAQRRRQEEAAALRERTARQRRARRDARENKFGSLAARYLVYWLAGGAVLFGAFGCIGGPLLAALFGGVGVVVTLFGWTLGRMDLKEKIDWRDRWEACPACGISGAGKLFHQEMMGERTVQYLQNQVAAIYRDGQKDGEIHYQVPTSYTSGTFCYFYECTCCGHKWVKLAEPENIPLHYQDFILKFQKQQVERARHRLESVYEQLLNPSEPPESCTELCLPVPSSRHA